MVDKLSPETRSKAMRAVKGKNTRPERLVRRVLHRMGYRFRLHRSDLPGTPDIVLPGRKIAIFVHGCFWHGHVGCPRSGRPSSNVEFWNAKLNANMARDAKNEERLRMMGWTVAVIWECETRDELALEAKISNIISERSA